MPASSTGLSWWIGVGPILVSLAVRWLWLPRVIYPSQALVVFVLGLATAEGTTILSTFLVRGSARHVMAILGILTVVHWMPIFARRFFSAPRGSVIEQRAV